MRLSKRSPLAGIVMAVCLLAAVQPVAARITRINPRPSETFSPILPLTLGGGVEWQQDSATTQWDFPFLFEYTFSEQFKIIIEPNYSYIKPRLADKDLRTVNGFGDLETFFEYEFLRERRYRPALTLEGGVKWPSASDPDLGDPGTNYSIGLIASKDFVYFDLDLEALYTFIGNPAERDLLELSPAIEVPLNYRFDFIAEVVESIRTGAHIEDASGGEFEATVGFAWHANKYLKLEQGVVFKERGEYQIVFAWEYSFAGEN